MQASYQVYVCYAVVCTVLYWCLWLRALTLVCTITERTIN
jgi:hypothetical protein